MRLHPLVKAFNLYYLYPHHMVPNPLMFRSFNNLRIEDIVRYHYVVESVVSTFVRVGWYAMYASASIMPSMSNNQPPAEETLWIVYDGECPLCSRFSTLYRAREIVQQVCLVDARSRDPIVAEIRARGFDLDAGMVVKLRDQYYHGAEALNVMALLGSDHTCSTGRTGRYSVAPAWQGICTRCLSEGACCCCGFLAGIRSNRDDQFGASVLHADDDAA